jgi:iron complex outermembrane receptor protein
VGGRPEPQRPGSPDIVHGVTTFDVGARYRTKVAGKDVVLRANIDNLTDKKYWLASGSFATNAAGRTIMLSASVDF